MSPFHFGSRWTDKSWRTACKELWVWNFPFHMCATKFQAARLKVECPVWVALLVFRAPFLYLLDTDGVDADKRPCCSGVQNTLHFLEKKRSKSIKANRRRQLWSLVKCGQQKLPTKRRWGNGSSRGLWTGLILKLVYRPIKIKKNQANFQCEMWHKTCVNFVWILKRSPVTSAHQTCNDVVLELSVSEIVLTNMGAWLALSPPIKSFPWLMPFIMFHTCAHKKPFCKKGLKSQHFFSVPLPQY